MKTTVWLGAVVAVLCMAATAAWVHVLAIDRPPPVLVTAVRYAPPTAEVADGVDVGQAEVARFVEQITNDPRGWRTDLDQFAVRIVQAGTEGTQEMPGRIGQAHPDEQEVVVSDEAWTVPGPRFAESGGTLADQRTWVVLHELGHLLGHDHQECPGTGPAPAMRATNYLIGGCDFNVWPNP